MWNSCLSLHQSSHFSHFENLNKSISEPNKILYQLYYFKTKNCKIKYNKHIFYATTKILIHFY